MTRLYLQGDKVNSHRDDLVYVDQDLDVAMLRSKNWKLLYQQFSHP